MNRTIFSLFLGLLFFLSTSFGPSNAKADWQLLPKNSHQLYQTYALFIDEQTSLLWYGAQRSWGAVAGNFAIYGNPDSPAHPELVAIASVNASMIFSDSGRIYTDEFDVHAGGVFEFALDPAYRLSLGAIHYSGHLAEGGVDRDLLDPNLGDNLLFARFLYDLGFYVRAGVTFLPVIHAGPSMNFFGGEEFFELFPFGGADDRQKPSPYIAFSFKQAGSEEFGMANIFHAQIGAYLGNHFTTDHVQTARLVAGFYTGVDPRLKYFVYKNKTDTFGYLGVMADF
ncbi:hypothetical protein WDW37_07795 [Bdellovibrionota bacterium FG-1]